MVLGRQQLHTYRPAAVSEAPAVVPAEVPRRYPGRDPGRVRSWLAIVAFVGLWQLASVTGLFGRYPVELMGLFLPSPARVWATARELLQSGRLVTHVVTSVYRVGAGFGLAALIGIPAGLAMAMSRTAEDVLQPFVRLFQPIPGVAWVPLAIIWFGLGDRAAIFIIAVGALFPILLNTRQGIRDVDPTLINAALTLGAIRRQLITKVYMPATAPYMITGFRLATGFAWRVVLAAEMVGVSRGLGYLLTLGRGIGRTDITLVTMFTIGILMMATDAWIFGRLEQVTSRWKQELPESERSNHG